MNHLIHGNNTVLSRQKLTQLVDQAKSAGIKDIQYIEGKKLNLSSAIEAFESISLFGHIKLLVIENLQSLNSTNRSPIVKLLTSNPTTSTYVIIWEPKQLTTTQLKPFASFTKHFFKISPAIFKFLESLAPGNEKDILTLYQKACHLDSAEFVFFMLVKHLKDLMSINHLKKPLPAWRKSKLLSQSKKFPPENLKSLHHRLTQIDWHIKSGQTILNLKDELELTLLSL